MRRAPQTARYFKLFFAPEGGKKEGGGKKKMKEGRESFGVGGGWVRKRQFTAM
jgi:hypothetical protein